MSNTNTVSPLARHNLTIVARWALRMEACETCYYVASEGQWYDTDEDSLAMLGKLLQRADDAAVAIIGEWRRSPLTSTDRCEPPSCS